MAGYRIDHQLIMFIGPPGAGKSTLSRWLYEQLVRHHIAASLLTDGPSWWSRRVHARPGVPSLKSYVTLMSRRPG